jgi:hypothetical protein
METKTRRYIATGEEYQTVMNLEVKVIRKGPQKREGQIYFLEVIRDYIHPNGPDCLVGHRFNHFRNDEAKRYEAWRVNRVGCGPEEATLEGQWED